MVLLAAGMVLWPQVRARGIERKVRPVVAGLAERDAGARCPRYLTSIFGAVGSVSLDSEGRIADRTELTGPVCDGLGRLLSRKGRGELMCLTTTAMPCTPEALRSVVALVVVTHESMHLRGVLDEGAAECAAIGSASRAALLAGLTPEQGRVIGWLHLHAVNPYTPPQYAVDPATCPAAAALDAQPPAGGPRLTALAAATSHTWTTLGD